MRPLFAQAPERSWPVVLTLRAAERRSQRFQERLGLVAWWVVRAVLDHVQRPSVAGAGGLGDPQPVGAVVPSPDQGCWDGDPRKILRRDSWQADLPQHAADRLPPGGASTVEVLRDE